MLLICWSEDRFLPDSADMIELNPSIFLAQILEFVRDGNKTVTDLMDLGKQLLGRWICVLPELPHFPASLRLSNKCNLKSRHNISQMIMGD